MPPNLNANESAYFHIPNKQTTHLLLMMNLIPEQILSSVRLQFNLYQPPL